MNFETRGIRFSRRMGEQFPCAEYAASVERPEPRMFTPGFWYCATLVLAVWSAAFLMLVA